MFWRDVNDDTIEEAIPHPIHPKNRFAEVHSLRNGDGFFKTEMISAWSMGMVEVANPKGWSGRVLWAGLGDDVAESSYSTCGG